MYNTAKRRLKRLLLFTVLLTITVLVVNNSVKTVFPLKYKEFVFRYSMENRLDPYLVFAIIKVESSFNPQAISSKKARGLMQLTEKTAVWGANVMSIEDFTIEKLYDPEINIRIGCWYLNRLMKEFDNDTDLVITAYNGGSGNVSEWLKDRNYSISGKNLDRIPFKETESYLKKVKNCHEVYKKLYEKGF